jgi:hypothetical protein
LYSSTNGVFSAAQSFNGTTSSFFGAAVAATGSYLAIGAPASLQGTGIGAVYVYLYSSTSAEADVVSSSTSTMYVLSGTLSGDAVSQDFGGVLAADGNYLAIGALNSAGKRIFQLIVFVMIFSVCIL